MIDATKTACNSNISDETVSFVFEGKILHFCEQECLDEFILDPQDFINSDHFLLEFQLLPQVDS